MRRALVWLLAIALTAALILGSGGTVVGGVMAAGEVRRAPAMLAAVALLVLLRGPRALLAAVGWTMLGTAGAVLLRNAAGFPADGGSIPGEVTSRAESLCEAGWLAAIAVLAWRGMAPRLSGLMLAAVVATTRIGGYGQALVPILWEDTLPEAMVLGIGVVAGLAGGLFVLILAGWCVSILVRAPERWLAPGRTLAALAAAAAVVHMLQS